MLDVKTGIAPFVPWPLPLTCTTNILMNKTTRSVVITFRTPARDQSPFRHPLHTRTLQDVPAPLAEQMVCDFRTSTTALKRDRSELYRYENNGGERLVALNFDEVEHLKIM